MRHNSDSAPKRGLAAVPQMLIGLLAIPSFVIGAGVAATLTTTASAQGQAKPPAKITQRVPVKIRFEDSPSVPSYEYKVVTSEADLNKFGALGWEYCGQSSGASISSAGSIVFTTYTMRRVK